LIRGAGESTKTWLYLSKQSKSLGVFLLIMNGHSSNDGLCLFMFQLKAFVNILPEDRGTDSISEAQHQLFNGVQLASAQGNLNLLKSSRISIADFDREDSQADDFHASKNHVSGGHNNGAQTVVGITTNRGTAEDLKHEQDGVIENSRGNRVSEWVEQDESGVYITLVSLPNGGRDLKRVRFRCGQSLNLYILHRENSRIYGVF
jgi:hypothetical protein